MQGRSREDAVAIAARAALRVLPVFWQWSVKNHKTEQATLYVLRATLISAVLSKLPNSKMENAAQSATSAIYAVLSSGGYKLTEEATKAAYSSANAAAVGSGGIRAAVDAVLNASYAAVGVDIWCEVRVDCETLHRGEDLLSTPLWSEENPYEKVWLNIKLTSSHAQNSPEKWRFWLDWYATMLNPTIRTDHWLFYQRVALIEELVWEDGVQAVATRISEIDYEMQLQSGPMAAVNENALLLANRLEAMQTMLDLLSERQSEQIKRSSEFEDQLQRVERDTSKSTKLKEKMLSDTEKAILQNEATIDQRFKELQAEYDSKFQASLDAFNAANRIKAPVELWSEKEREHDKRRGLAFRGFVFVLIVIAIAVGGVVYWLLNPNEQLLLALSPVGCDPVGHPELCKGFSFRGMILSGSVLTLLTLALWFARIQMKEYLSERHLVLDARERRAFAQTYIGLLDHGDEVNKEAQEQRALVYAALFRPSSDGIIKDEGGIDPSLTAALSKLLAGK